MYCTDASAVNPHGELGAAISLRCRRWSCPNCAPVRRRQLKQDARRGRPNTFLTLTANPEVYDSPEARAVALAQAWRKIRRQARKVPGNNTLPFLAVFERTKKGEPHLHILCRSAWIDQRWLSKRLSEETGAFIVDVRRIRHIKKISAYVAKYIAKDPHKFAGTKRYWRSQDYALEQKPKIEQSPVFGPTWIRDPLRFDRLVQRLLTEDRVVGWRNDMVLFVGADRPQAPGTERPP